MYTAKRGSPVYYRDNLVAKLALTTAIPTRGLEFSWFSPNAEDGYLIGPKYVEVSGQMVPANRGVIGVDYARGDLTILVAKDMHGDISTAFLGREMFMPPDVEVSELPDGVGNAARIVKNALPNLGQHMELSHWLDALIERGAEYARRKGL